MPLHKPTRASRLDPTMISAPLGDFRHTMHIGRGGDAFGDTSFLSTLGPSPPGSDPGMSSADYRAAVNHSDHQREPPQNQEPEWVSSFTLDLDLDLGPSMLGDVLGVMDALGLDSNDVKGAFGPKDRASPVDTKQGKMPNGKNSDGPGDGRTPHGLKPKGLRPKVRFSDKREEIIRHAFQEEEGQGFDFREEDLPESPTRLETGESATAAHTDLPPSPASSRSSDFEGVSALDRRREGGRSESDSEEEEEAGRGYTFEDEFDDEIGL